MINQNDHELIYSHIKTINVLYVEDSKVTQLQFQSIVKDIFKSVIYAGDGVDGYQKFLDNDIDIVITDYLLPKRDGLSMVKKIKEKKPQTPVMFVSEIKDLDVIIQALNLDIHTFVKKPIDKNELLHAIESTTKVFIANKFLKDEKNKQFLELQAKDEYKSYQEDLGFAKELNILRNDFYYQMTDINHDVSLLDFLYNPLDVMSGDAYSARYIDNNEILYIIVDGMGKGFSASLTTMIFISFANHMIDKMIELDNFDFSNLINETMEYIKPILLEEEALSLDYVLINYEEKRLYYSKFSMPPILMQNTKDAIIKLKSNNPPLSKYSETFNIDSYNVSDVNKYLIYSDGIVENRTNYENKSYSSFIEDDFLQSFTREDLKNKFMEKVDKQEDDITLIFINNISQYSNTIAHKQFKSTMANLDLANQWYEKTWEDLCVSSKTSYQAGMVFTELYMNAHEHGNLELTSEEKQKLMLEDEYFDELSRREKNFNRDIDVKVDKVKHGSYYYIITKITDEGNGFDTHILSTIFRNSQRFHGRGVFVSRKNSFGIYYNSKGNSVLFINKLEESNLIEEA